MIITYIACFMSSNGDVKATAKVSCYSTKYNTNDCSICKIQTTELNNDNHESSDNNNNNNNNTATGHNSGGDDTEANISAGSEDGCFSSSIHSG